MERRERARVAVALPASFSGGSVAGGGLVTELSAGGCTLVSEELLLGGTTLVLTIHLPEQALPLRVDLAEVRWADGRTNGLKFRRLRLEEKQRLRQLLALLGRKEGRDFRRAG
jgi:hypothetical protein